MKLTNPINRWLILNVMLLLFLACFPRPAQAATDCTLVSEIPQIECQALVALYTSTDGPNWTNQTGWNQTNTPCSWYGVTCSGGRVTQLNLPVNKLKGAIPSEIANLTNLTRLFLYNNLLTPLPPEIGNLINLTYLDLSANGLTLLPPEIGNLTNLTDLRLSYNRLTSLPPEIGNLTNLIGLYVVFNQLTSLPPEIGNLTNLTSLDLYNNQLSSLPSQIGNLTNLTYLDLSFNQLISLPSQIGNLTNLTDFFLNDNQLTSLPLEIGNFTNLINFYLYRNKLTSLPSSIGNLANLTGLYVFNNQLTSLPLEVGNLTNLINFDVSVNKLTSLPSEVGDLTNLNSLSLYDNQLIFLPPQIGNLSNLGNLFLNNNQLTSLPPEIGNLTNLIGLYVHNNQLASLPLEISNIVNLTQLSLNNNQLTSLPSQISNLTNLTDFDVSYNALPSGTSLDSFLNTKDPGWADSQTVPVTNLQSVGQTQNSLTLTWTPIVYTSGGGYYEINYDTVPGPPYSHQMVTTDKTVSSQVINGLTANTTYFVSVRTYSADNDLWSVYSTPIQISTAAASRPDLTLINLAVTPATTICKGEAVTATLTVYNQGLAQSTSSSLYLYQDNSPTGYTNFTSQQTIGLLQPEQTANFSFVNLSPTVGTWYLKFLADPANGINESDETNNAISTTVTVNVDKTPPTGFIIINNGNGSTNNPNVTLTLSADDLLGTCHTGVTQMRFQNEGQAWSSWESYSPTKSWVLPSTLGQQKVYVQYQDAEGNLSDSYFDTINGFNNLPVAQSVAITPTNPIAPQMLTVTYQFSDADSSDSENKSQTQIRWYRNGTLQAAYNNQITVPVTVAGELWSVSVQPHDGIELGNIATSAEVTVIADPLPFALFTVSRASGPSVLTVNFDSSASRNYHSCLWDFDNGNTLSVCNPLNETFKYPDPPLPSQTYITYTVALTVTGARGSAMTSTVITVYQPCVAKFSTIPASPVGTAPFSVQFINESSGACSSALWNFGNGLISADFNPTVVFTQSSNVVLTMNGPGAPLPPRLPSSANSYITINPTVGLTFTAVPTIGPASLPVRFQANITGSYTSLKWDFGDGGNGTALTSTHTYVTPGSYTVTLTINSALGTQIITRPRYITVTRPVVAKFDFSPIVAKTGQTVAVTSTSTGDVVAWQWQLSNGLVFTTPTFSQGLTTTTGITLTVMGLGGDTDNLTKIVPVYTPCEPDFDLTLNPASGQAPVLVNFVNTSRGDCRLVSWNFGDGSTPSAVLTPTHEYPFHGHYTITLIMRDEEGQKPVSKTIEVKGLSCAVTVNPLITPAEPWDNDNLTFTYNRECHLRQRLEDDKIVWYQNGVPIPYFNDKTVVSASYTYPNDKWQVEVTPCQGSNCGNSVKSPTVFIRSSENTPPEALQVTIVPTSPLNTEALTVTYVYTDRQNDPEGDSLFFWKRNGELQSYLTRSLVIQPNETYEDDIWCVTVSPHDGKDYGEESPLDCVKIGSNDNHAPQVLNQSLHLIRQVTQAELYLDYRYFDLDSDKEIQRQIQWYRITEREPEGKHQPEFNDQLTLKRNVTLAGELWFAQIRVYDGKKYSLWTKTSQVQIKEGSNTPPRLENVYISPTEPTTQDKLKLHYDFIDVDGDVPGEMIITWFNPLTYVESYDDMTTIPVGVTKAGETWFAWITPVDVRGAVGEAVHVKSVTIHATEVNNLPTVKEVSISPSHPVSTSTLEVSYIFEDEDKDKEGATQIVWEINGQPTPYTHTIVDGTIFKPVNTVWCAIVTPIDIRGAGGIPVKSKPCVTIGSSISNTRPSITNVHIFPEHPSAKKNLELTYDIIDPDCNYPPCEFKTEITWFKNGRPQSGLKRQTGVGEAQPAFRGQSVVPSGVITPGEIWTVKIKPHDGQEYGQEYLVQSVQINYPPIITAIHVSSLTPYAKQPITVTCDYFDKDNNPTYNSAVIWERDEVRQTQFDSVLVSSTSIFTLPANETTMGQTWVVTCIPNDGVDIGQPLSQTLTITKEKILFVYLPTLIQSRPQISIIYLPMLLKLTTSTPTDTPTPTNTPVSTPTATPRCRSETRYEENDSLKEACLITPDIPISGTFPSGPYPDDEDDVYDFILTQHSSIKVKIENYRPLAPGQLAVYACPFDLEHIPDGESYINKLESLNGEAELRVRYNKNGQDIFPPGRYCIRVYTYRKTFNPNQPYKLSLEVIPR